MDCQVPAARAGPGPPGRPPARACRSRGPRRPRSGTGLALGVVGRGDAAEDLSASGWTSFSRAEAPSRPWHWDPSAGQNRRPAFQSSEQPLHIQRGVPQHQRCHVHDLGRQGRDRPRRAEPEPADRLHLVNRGHVHAVAVTEVSEQHVIALTEVEHARGRAPGRIGLEPRRNPLVDPAVIPSSRESAGVRQPGGREAPGSTLPVDVLGSAWQNSTTSGTMYPGSRRRQWSRTSSLVRLPRRR